MVIMVCFCLPGFSQGESEQTSNLLTWLVNNWPVIALALSELAALFSAKWRGIIQTVLKIVGLIFSALDNARKRKANKMKRV